MKNLILPLIFLMSLCSIFASDAKLDDEFFLKNDDGEVTGFQFNIYNRSLDDGSTIIGVCFSIAIYKYEDDKKIFLGLELFSAVCLIQKSYYKIFKFDFDKKYGKESDIEYEFKWTYNARIF